MKARTVLKIGLVFAVAGSLLAGLRWRAAHHRAPQFRPVQVTRGDVQVTVLATGTVQPQNRLELKPPIAGRVEEILVEEGRTVEQGQVLARMSSTERAALLDAARAKGPKELAHWDELYRPTSLVAPIDGMVIARNVEPGQSVTASDAVLVLSDRLIVKTQVDETDIGQIALDQAAHITLDAYPEQEIDGRVDHIAYEAKTVNNVTIYEVDVLPAQVPEAMRSGMTANVTFLIATAQEALLLPAEAVHQGLGGTTVLVPEHGPRHPVSRPVVTGLNDGKHVEIVSGLHEGDTVLVAAMPVPRGSGPGARNPLSPWGRAPRPGGRQHP